MPKFSHFDMEARICIQAEIEKGTTLTKLARKLSVPRSSVYREIKRNSSVKKGKWRMFPHTLDSLPCPLIKKFPFVCNSCPKAMSNRCSKDIVTYDAFAADGYAREDLVSSRSNPRLKSKGMKELDDKVSPKVIDGQSLYNIVGSDPSLGVSESTLRRYIGKRYLAARNIDLPRATRFHVKREYDYGRKHVDAKLLQGRTFKCFLDWKKGNPKSHYLEIDTVIGKATDTLCILTVYDPDSKFQWGYLLPHTSSAINKALLGFLGIIGENGPFKAFLGDNGPEFSGLPQVEQDENGVIRIRVFYCDPYRSGEKGGCESNHRLIRYIYKKGTSFSELQQSDVDSLFSQIDSLRRRSLNGESPAEAFQRLYGDEVLRATGVSKRDSKTIILKKKTNK